MKKEAQMTALRAMFDARNRLAANVESMKRCNYKPHLSDLRDIEALDRAIAELAPAGAVPPKPNPSGATGSWAFNFCPTCAQPVRTTFESSFGADYECHGGHKWTQTFSTDPAGNPAQIYGRQ